MPELARASGSQPYTDPASNRRDVFSDYGQVIPVTPWHPAIQHANSSQCLAPHTPESHKMAAPKLPFLWPMLWKPQLAPRVRSRVRAPRTKRTVTTTSFRSVEAPIQRYGKAHEPAPHLRAQLSEQGDPVPPKIPHDPAQDVEEEEDEADAHVFTEPPVTPAKPPTKEADAPPAPAPAPKEPPKQDAAKPLDSVLHMPGPSDEAHKPPHLKTPPYVHHFDTYGLVRQLAKSNYTEEQSISLMKAVRGLLIENMMLARQGLVSKSNVENETYLFRAACAELKTEIGNLRTGEVERMRTERNQLQHEVDILGQKLGQETGSVKDDLKGLFDDRKMAVRQEQRGMETKVRPHYILHGNWLGGMLMIVCADPGTQLPNHNQAQLGRAF